MTSPSAERHALIATRATATTKARFAALAARQGLSESALLTLLVETVLRDNDADDADPITFDQAPSSLSDRVTLRLRAGDRRRIESRAALRQLSLSRYVVSLVRAHVREDPSLPSAELDTLKAAVNALSAVNRTLIEFNQALGRTDLTDRAITASLGELLTRVDAVHRAVGDLVRANLISWEAGDG